MDKDTQVYCANCKHLKIDLSQDYPFVCDFELDCNIWEAEDSRPFSNRPFYEEGDNGI